jgi:hypothetical protein
MSRYTRILALATLIPLLAIGIAACKDDNPVTPGPDDHEEAEGLVISRGSNDLVTVSEGTVTGSLSVKADQRTENLTIWFLDADGDRFQPDDTTKTLEFTVAKSDIAEIEREAGRWTFQLKGKSAGSTTLEVRLMHAGHPDFRTPAIPVTVTP